TGRQGIEEIAYVMEQSVTTSFPPNLAIDFTLARGLDYYTGIIFEAKAPHRIKMGSIGGGGRYDDLTSFFGVPNIPGVGISFGVDRIFDVMEELHLFPETIEAGTQVLFFNMGEEESKAAYGYVHALRQKGVATELFHEAIKKEKQFKYAERKSIPLVAIIDKEQMLNRSCSVKNIKTGLERSLSFDLLVSTLTDDLVTSPLSSGLKS
ncbi:MAG: ATP phosphoribosyltransferase regulatory subunit, partial [Chitinophagaceae bacterium]